MDSQPPSDPTPAQQPPWDPNAPPAPAELSPPAPSVPGPAPELSAAEPPQPHTLFHPQNPSLGNPETSSDSASIVTPTPVEPPVPQPGQPETPGAVPPVAPAVVPPAAMPVVPVAGSAYGQASFTGQSPTEPQSFSQMSSQKKPHKKRLLIVSGAVALVVLLFTGSVFGYYLPNRPENIWKTGMSRSGKALNQLVVDSSKPATLDSFKKVQISAKVTGTSQGNTYSGTLDAKVDSKHAAGLLTVKGKASGQTEQTFSTKFIESRKDDTLLPDIYLQFTGLNSFGISTFYPALTTFEGKWIGIDSTYLKSLGLESAATQSLGDTELKPSDTITSADYSEAAQAVSGVMADYVFTGDKSKSILEERSYVGKEKIEGITAYHYTFGENDANGPAFCTAFVNKVYGTKLYNKLNPKSTGSEKAAAIKDCSGSFKDGKKTSYDIWIDGKYKLIYKVRFNDTSNKQAWTEIGQKYTGGDDVGLFLRSHEGGSKMDTQAKLNINLKTHKVTGSVTSKDISAGGYSIEASLSAEPYSGTIDTTKPAGAIPIQDVLSKIGLNTDSLL